MSKHCFFAPSEGHIWVNCPYMLKLKRLYQYILEKPPGEAAGHGTLMHSYVNLIITNMKNKWGEIKYTNFSSFKSTIIDSIYQYTKNDKELTKKDFNILEDITEWLIDNVFIKAKDINNINTEQTYSMNINQTNITDINNEDNIFGTVDLNFIDKEGILNVIDFKFGQIYVEVDNNIQLKIYDCLILDSNKDNNCKYIRNWIYQPTSINEETGMLNINNQLIKKDIIEDFKKQISNIINVFNLNKKIGARDGGIIGSHCKYCKYKCKCRAAFKEAKLLPEIIKMNKNTPSDPVIIERYIEIADRAKRFLKDFDEYITQQIVNENIQLDNYNLIQIKREILNIDKETTIKKILEDNDILPYKQELVTTTDLKREYLKEDPVKYNKAMNQLKDNDCIKTTYSKPFLKKKGGK